MLLGSKQKDRCRHRVVILHWCHKSTYISYSTNRERDVLPHKAGKRLSASPVEEDIGLTMLHLLKIYLCHILVIKLIPLLIDVVEAICRLVATWWEVRGVSSHRKGARLQTRAWIVNAFTMGHVKDESFWDIMQKASQRTLTSPVKVPCTQVLYKGPLIQCGKSNTLIK